VGATATADAIEPHVHLRTPDPARVRVLVTAHGGRAPHHGSRLKIGMPAVQLAGPAAAENIALALLLHSRIELRQ
jgi:hypothetical protein